ncbi:MAG: hypothetical protein V2G42_00535 [bacterium JZ-2024 1]
MKFISRAWATLVVTSVFVVVLGGRLCTAKTIISQDYTVPSGTLEKEVSVTFGNLRVLGTVTDSVRVTSGDVEVTGEVGQNVEVTLGNAVIGGHVAGKVVARQGDVSVSGFIGSELTVILGDATISGKVKGPVLIRSGDLILKGGTIEGNVDVALGDVTLEGGEITGSLQVRGGRVSGDISLVKGETSVQDAGVQAKLSEEGLEDLQTALKSLAKAVSLPASLLALLLFVVLSLFLFVIAFFLVLALLYLFRIPTARAREYLTRDEIFITLLSGAGGAFAVLAAVLILAITIIFIPIAVLLASITLILLIFGFAALAIVTGESIFRHLLKWNVPDWLCPVLGFLILLGLLVVPVIRGLAFIAYLLLSLGVSFRVIFGAKRKQQPPAMHTNAGGSAGSFSPPEMRTPLTGKSDSETLSTGDTQGRDPAL